MARLSERQSLWVRRTCFVVLLVVTVPTVVLGGVIMVEGAWELFKTAVAAASPPAVGRDAAACGCGRADGAR